MIILRRHQCPARTGAAQENAVARGNEKTERNYTFWKKARLRAPGISRPAVNGSEERRLARADALVWRVVRKKKKIELLRYRGRGRYQEVGTYLHPLGTYNTSRGWYEQ